LARISRRLVRFLKPTCRGVTGRLEAELALEPGLPPPATMDAFREHGILRASRHVVAILERQGISGDGGS
jgi:hypothetical protein